MADIVQLMQTFLDTENRLTSIEHRLSALESRPAKRVIDPEIKSLIRWGLIVAGLAAAQVPLDQAIKLASGLP